MPNGLQAICQIWTTGHGSLLGFSYVEWITSASLRCLLIIRKSVQMSITRLINDNETVYGFFETAGFGLVFP